MGDKNKLDDRGHIIMSATALYGDGGFSVGQRIQHKTLGWGTVKNIDVCMLVDPPKPFANIRYDSGKYDVCFPEDVIPQ